MALALGLGVEPATVLSRPPKVLFSTWRSSVRVCSVDLVRMKVRVGVRVRARVGVGIGLRVRVRFGVVLTVATSLWS